MLYGHTIKGTRLVFLAGSISIRRGGSSGCLLLPHDDPVASHGLGLVE